MPASARIKRTIRALGCLAGGGDLCLDLFARAEAWIEQSKLLKDVQMRLVVSKVIGLTPHGSLPTQPKPSEVLEDGVLKLWPRAGAIDVLQTDEESATGDFCLPKSKPRRISMTQMQQTRGRRGKTRDFGLGGHDRA